MSEQSGNDNPYEPTHAGVVITNRAQTRVLAFAGSWDSHWETPSRLVMRREYLLPKGHIEKDETPKEAAIREIAEEVGIETMEEELTLIGMMPSYDVPERQDPDDPEKTKPAETIKVMWFYFWMLTENFHWLPKREKPNVEWVTPDQLSREDHRLLAWGVVR